MKHGIVLTAIYPALMNDCEALISRIREISRQGVFNCIEFYFAGSEQDENKIAEALKQYGLTAVFLAGFPMKQDKVDLTSGDEKIRNASVSKVMRLYDQARRLGAAKMLIVGGPNWKERDEDKIAEQARLSFRELDRYAEDGGPEITLEYFPVEREPYHALGNTKLIYKIFATEEYKHIGITFDTSHVAQLGENMLESFQVVKPWIHHLHFANSMSKIKEHPMYGDKHPLFALENGDYTLEQIRNNYLTLQNNKDLEQIDIGSIEVISRGNEDWYYEKTLEEAQYIWMC